MRATTPRSVLVRRVEPYRKACLSGSGRCRRCRESSDQKAVMSTIRIATRSTTRAFERLAARRYSARSQRELNEALAGTHGEDVRADVLAAMNRQAA
jgi:hypothetical protein